MEADECVEVQDLESGVVLRGRSKSLWGESLEEY